MTQPTITTHIVHRASFTTSRPWDDVVRDLRAQAGRTEDTLTLWGPEGTDALSIAHSVNSRIGPGGLFMFHERPLSEVFKHFAPPGTFCPKATQFVLGNALTAARMYQKWPRVGLLIPPRVSVVELPEGRGTEIAYDLPTSVIGGESEEARVIAESAEATFEKFALSLL